MMNRQIVNIFRNIADSSEINIGIILDYRQIVNNFRLHNQKTDGVTGTTGCAVSYSINRNLNTNKE